MSVKYKPVIWNRGKIVYDIVLVVMIVAFIALFLRVAPLYSEAASASDVQIQRMRAFGLCAFLLLSVALAIGPACRIDRRFLPLLYNRRHLGVATAVVAFSHAAFVVDWYYNYSAIDPYAAVLGSNTSYGQLLGFPFEAFGIAALLILVVLAATSHDFWLSFLTPPVWKTIHMSVYAAYGLVVAHIAFGHLQDGSTSGVLVVTVASVVVVVGLHLVAAWRDGVDERALRAASGVAMAEPGPAWIAAGDPTTIPNGRARVVELPGGSRVAIFRHGGDKLSAVSNACAHQNGPLGEGRIVGGAITCPWHGYNYRPEDGCSPPPFTEKIATFNLRLEAGVLMLDPVANPPGTRVEPLVSAVVQPASAGARR
ncbi:MAG: ferric reductase-like transmembrane domain-containing protein [Hyphomicrobiaceae bacterium]|nr:ferric reductase-like transmembrane domain-containing protein [Hyphomicrobiaceae bacterium]